MVGNHRWRLVRSLLPVRMGFQNKRFEFKTFWWRWTQFLDVFESILARSILVTPYGKFIQNHNHDQITKAIHLTKQQTFDYAAILS